MGANKSKQNMSDNNVENNKVDAYLPDAVIPNTNLPDAAPFDDDLPKVVDPTEELKETNSAMTGISKPSSVTLSIFPNLKNLGDRKFPVVKNLQEFYKSIIGNTFLEDIGKVDFIDYSDDDTYYYDSKVIKNGLLAAIHVAFMDHYELVLTPDIIWTTIMQGFAIHINMNAEKFRKIFVKHEGKKKIVINRDGFTRRSGKNDWSTVFGDFSTCIKEEIGEKTHSMVVNDFSTTGPVERIVSEIVLMDTVSKYFEYEVCTKCGIPKITLLGSELDWKKLQEKFNNLKKMNTEHKMELDFWLPHLSEVIDNIVRSVKYPKLDSKLIEFWSSIYKYQSMSGGASITGWLATLFPYIYNYEYDKETNNGVPEYVKNYAIQQTPDNEDTYLSLKSIPNGLSKVSFIWDYFGTRYDMAFFGGFFGVTQDPTTLALKPAFGWAVAEQ